MWSEKDKVQDCYVLNDKEVYIILPYWCKKNNIHTIENMIEHTQTIKYYVEG